MAQSSQKTTGSQMQYFKTKQQLTKIHIIWFETILSTLNGNLWGIIFGKNTNISKFMNDFEHRRGVKKSTIFSTGIILKWAAESIYDFGYSLHFPGGGGGGRA